MAKHYLQRDQIQDHQNPFKKMRLESHGHGTFAEYVPSIPVRVATATTPEQLIHAIETTPKAFWHKDELVGILHILNKLHAPTKFIEPCSYIG